MSSPNPKDFNSFEEFDKAWHEHFQASNPRWRESEMYANAQYDSIPYGIWEDAGLNF